MNLLLADIVDFINKFTNKEIAIAPRANLGCQFTSFKPANESDPHSICYITDDPRSYLMLRGLVIGSNKYQIGQYSFEHPEVVFLNVDNPRLWYLRLVERFYNEEFSILTGEDCRIDKYAMIGENGYGYERDEYGEPQLFLHMGGVKIGHRVHIGSFTTIDRALFKGKFTEIGDGSKIDAQCHIGHNVKIGKNCMMTAGAVIGGSVEIGDNCYFGLSATIESHVKLGDHCIVGSNSYIRKNWPEQSVIYGNDIFLGWARDKKEWMNLVGLSPSQTISLP